MNRHQLSGKVRLAVIEYEKLFKLEQKTNKQKDLVNNLAKQIPEHEIQWYHTQTRNPERRYERKELESQS